MKYFTLFLAFMLVAFMLPENLMAQSGCQPKACSKSMADANKATTTSVAYLKVDLKAVSQPSCSKAGEVKAVNASVATKYPGLACKPGCDPTECPPVCCEEGGKAGASAQQVSQQTKASCEPKNCKTATGKQSL